jgi:bis(5'-nucleosyl)-tetraphosphatase (symmetrical)
MATYAIGDIQGCFAQLQQLLKKIHFHPAHDHLWFVGDLVNRGPDSLATLRFVKDLVEKQRAITVLGNHDLHLLAVGSGIRKLKDKDTFGDVLDAPDVKKLLAWLREQPLFYYDKTLNYALVHAGLAPQWTLVDALTRQNEISQILRGEHCELLLHHMYSTKPVDVRPSHHLTDWQRYRSEIDYFTRMRFCTAEGLIDLKTTGPATENPPGYYPWFRIPNRANQDLRIIFGHWASLQGKAADPNVFALDTGCIWGNCLTAMRLEDQERFSVSCK